jgi:hypothetical protein
MAITVIKFILLFGMDSKVDLSHKGKETMRTCEEEEEEEMMREQHQASWLKWY